MAEMPSAPPRSAARAGTLMSVMLGVILAHTGTLETFFTQRVTSSTISGFWPMAAPMARSGRPWGQERLSSKASMPVSWVRSTISAQRSSAYSSMMEAISMRSG